MSRLDGSFIKVASIPADRFQGELLGKFVVVSWGEQVVVDPTTSNITLQLLDLAGDPLEAAHVLRVTCDDQADLTVGVAGTALAGDGTEDLIAQTDAAGALELVVTCAAAVVISVLAGPTQASPMLDCSTGAEVSFV